MLILHRAAVVAVLGVALGACSTHEIKLAAGAGQEAIVRDGIPALVSRKKHVVMLRPNNVLLKNNPRPAFTVVVRNAGSSPETLLMSEVTATQLRNARREPVKVFRYDELVQEEETRQALQTFGAVLGGVARAMSAANAGQVNTTGTVQTYGPYGPSYGTFTASTRDPVRAQIAQDAAAAETRADFAAIREQGERNLVALQRTILKDNTVLAGEWIGGTIVLAQPEFPDGKNASYLIRIGFGGEVHEFQVSQLQR